MWPRRYRFVIEGTLEHDDGFDGLSFGVQGGDTVITGPLRDGDHLMTVLRRVLALDAVLVELQALDP
jgi:hypothetical protein